MPQNTKNMFSRRKTAEPICDMKTMPGRFTYEFVSEMEGPGNAKAHRFRGPKAVGTMALMMISRSNTVRPNV